LRGAAKANPSIHYARYWPGTRVCSKLNNTSVEQNLRRIETKCPTDSSLNLNSINGAVARILGNKIVSATIIKTSNCCVDLGTQNDESLRSQDISFLIYAKKMPVIRIATVIPEFIKEIPKFARRDPSYRNRFSLDAAMA